jgi:hypothetical protein
MPEQHTSTPDAQAWDGAVVSTLIDELTALRADLTALETRMEPALRAVHPDHTAGAVNLVHYVGLRRHDVRALQDQLAGLGLRGLQKWSGNAPPGQPTVADGDPYPSSPRRDRNDRRKEPTGSYLAGPCSKRHSSS